MAPFVNLRFQDSAGHLLGLYRAFIFLLNWVLLFDILGVKELLFLHLLVCGEIHL